jgi:uncharacterized protein YkwD
MRNLQSALVLSLALCVPVFLAPAQTAAQQGSLQPEAGQLLALANQSRAAAGAGPLSWDPALAAAARRHCLRMAAEGPIAHRYNDELDVSGRAAQAGAHFSLIEENVAIGPDPVTIHSEWMHSPGHRANLLSPDVNRVGMAVVASRGVLYAVADYSRAVPVLTQNQVEAAIAGLIRDRGVTVIDDSNNARAACAEDRGYSGIEQPGFIMRWQGADLTRLPQPLLERMASGRYRKAAVGSCPTGSVEGSFTAYRLAVLLY